MRPPEQEEADLNSGPLRQERGPVQPAPADGDVRSEAVRAIHPVRLRDEAAAFDDMPAHPKDVSRTTPIFAGQGDDRDSRANAGLPAAASLPGQRITPVAAASSSDIVRSNPVPLERASEPPPVVVEIGSIEFLSPASATPIPAPVAPPRRTAALTLDAYLARRRGER